MARDIQQLAAPLTLPPTPSSQAQCDSNGKQFPSWGRRRRRALTPTLLAEDPRDPESMTLSQEIMVLDFGDEPAAGVQRQQQSSLPEVQLPPYVTQETAFGAPAAAAAAGQYSRLTHVWGAD